VTKPLISIIIPVCLPEHIQTCLNSIKSSDYNNIEVIVVINSFSKCFIGKILSEIGKATSNHIIKEKIKIIKVNETLGFAAACNLGFSQSRGEYILFLNDDSIIEENLISEMIALCEKDPNIACAQPKILSFKDRKHFDYAGAAGGFIDLYGVPFCAGRIFDSIEEDHGQYDNIKNLFWASGTCLFSRRTVLEQVGLFQEKFFSHMEEIDLAFRILKKGYKIILNPKVRAYHMGAQTSKKLNINSDFLKYRNNLMMIFINFEIADLMKIIIPRIFLDTLNFLTRICKREVMQASNILKAYWAVIRETKYILHKRRQLPATDNRYLEVGVCSKSIAILYKLKGMKHFYQIKGMFNA
jgi:GT2 family glycosyltransferase